MGNDDHPTVRPRLLADAIVVRSETVERVDATVVSTMTTIADVTERHAEMEKAVAESTHAVPAREETKRAQQDTWRLGIVGGIVVLGGIAICVKPDVSWQIVAIVSVLSGVFGGSEIARRLRSSGGHPK